MHKSLKRKLEIILKAVTVMLCVTVTALIFITRDNRVFNLTPRLADSSESFVRLIDVGQGDSILLHSNGYTALIDTGAAENSSQLISSVSSLGIDTVDVLILSHLHLDHTGGVSEIYRNFQVENLILPQLSTFSEGIYSAELAIDKMTRAGKGVYTAEEGMKFALGEFEIEVLACYSEPENENNRSVIIKAYLKDKAFLFMGDAEAQTEKLLLGEDKNIDCDVLKVGHHGSSSSTSLDFLKEASPEVALISVGKNNIYGHPHRSTIKLLKDNGINIHRTDRQGDITVRVKNGEISVETEK